MKTKSIWVITFLALASILFLQGMWLHNTYKLYDAEFKKKVRELFILSVNKEKYWQLSHPVIDSHGERKMSIVFPNMENESIENSINFNKIFQDSMYVYNKEGIFPPFSLEKLDSIFNAGSKNIYKKMYYLAITDSLGKQVDFLNHYLPDFLINHFTHKETVQLRNIDPVYITIGFSSLYITGYIFGRMGLLLIGSVIVAAFVAFSLIRQIRIIRKQELLAKQRQDFTHSMVHDLKNPVTSIITGINALKSGKLDEKPEMKEHFYSIITQESNRIHQLVNKVLEVANLENGSAVLSKTSVNLPDLINGLTDKYQTGSEKPVYFHIELNGVETIYADRHYIYEAFDNLIENAVKYSKENEDADITIASIQNGNETQLSFKDLGIGISEKDQKRIFQKFERSMAVISSKNKTSGFGLGLNFVSQVIKAHGGTIKVKSKLGAYSEFIIDLPNKDGNEKTITD